LQEEAESVDINEVLHRAGEHLAVGRAFGPPYEQDGTLVIPVAVVGGGGGGGNRAKPAEEEGGGFGGLVYPLGSYVVSGGRVRFVPVFDVTLIVTGALLLMRLVVKRSWRRH
jgi:uncharacterized spore protein YtfJ